MLDLAQVFSLIHKTIRRKFSPTPRELIEWTAPLTFDFASYYNYALFYVTIALCYATIAPLVSPFALLYFTVSYGVHKYDMMYVYFTRNETGGSMWTVHHSSKPLTSGLIQSSTICNWIFKCNCLCSGLCQLRLATCYCRPATSSYPDCF